MLNNGPHKLANAETMWQYLSILILCIYASIMVMQWQRLPLFVDMFYHLKTAKMFAKNGTICLYNFWEYAPYGMPNIYPPLVHTIMALLLNVGVNGIVLVKVISLLSPIMLLCAIYYIVQNTIGPKIAFFTLISIAYSRLFIITSSFTVPATIAVALLLYAALSIHKKKILLSAAILAIIHYTHTGVGVCSVIFIIFLGLFKAVDIKDFLILLISPLLMASPWLCHIYTSLKDITFNNSAILPLTVYIIPFLFAIIGVFVKIDKTIKALFLSLLIALVGYSMFYPFRGITSQFATGIYIFSGIGLTAIFDILDRLFYKLGIIKRYRYLILSSMIFISVLMSVSLVSYDSDIKIKNNDSVMNIITFNIYNKSEDIFSSNIYNKKDIELLSEHIYENTEEDNIIWSNYRYLAGLLSIETGRPAATSMLLEVHPDKKPDVNESTLIFIIKDVDWDKSNLNIKLEENFRTIATEAIDNEVIYIMKNKKGKTF